MSSPAHQRTLIALGVRGRLGKALEQRFGLGASCDDREIPPDQCRFVEAGAEAELAKAKSERAVIDCAQLLGRDRRVAFEQTREFIGERGVELCGLRPVHADAGQVGLLDRCHTETPERVRIVALGHPLEQYAATRRAGIKQHQVIARLQIAGFRGLFPMCLSSRKISGLIGSNASIEVIRCVSHRRQGTRVWHAPSPTGI